MLLSISRHCLVADQTDHPAPNQPFLSVLIVFKKQQILGVFIPQYGNPQNTWKTKLTCFGTFSQDLPIIQGWLVQRTTTSPTKLRGISRSQTSCNTTSALTHTPIDFQKESHLCFGVDLWVERILHPPQFSCSPSPSSHTPTLSITTMARKKTSFLSGLHPRSNLSCERRSISLLLILNLNVSNATLRLDGIPALDFLDLDLQVSHCL